MNYYITGYSGFTGQAFARYLKTESVFAIPRGLTIEQLREIFKTNRPDFIINLSTYGNHYNQTDFYQMVQSNIIDTFNLLESLRDIYYKRFFHVSTSSVNFGPRTRYSITKDCGEKMASMYKNVIISRPYSIYGPGEAAHRFIPTVIRSLNSGEQMTLDEQSTHDWIYVDDCVEAILDGKTEIGRGVKTTNLEVVRILEQISGKKLNYIPGKLRVYDNTNWLAREGVDGRSLHEGLKLVYDQFE